MKKKIALKIPFGLSELIICNGLIRKLLKRYDSMVLFVGASDLSNSRRMFSDIKTDKLRMLWFPNEKAAETAVKAWHRAADVMILNGKASEWEKIYEQAGVDPKERWEAFGLKRNLNSEVRMPSKDFVLVCDVPQNFALNIKSEWPITTTHRMDHIFYWCWCLENAKEVHTYNPAFIALAENLKSKGNYFLHERQIR